MTDVEEEPTGFSPPVLGEPTPSLEACLHRQGERPPARYRVLEPDGSYDPDDVPPIDADTLVEVYRWMLLQQRYDERMVKLQRRGEMGTVATARGQEASVVGVSFGLERRDWLLPYGREAAALVRHGVSMRDLLLYWLGVAEANRLPDANSLPFAIAIGTHLPVGVGYAWGLDLDGADAIVAMLLGDGQLSTGEAQAALNWAGVIGAPAVFVCLNNQYAISTPFERQTGTHSAAQKAMAWGLDGLRVDGNDALAMVAAMRWARRRAREGTPVLLEAVTYRLDAHTTNDDPSRYRDDAEVEWWRERDPIPRYRAFLEAEGLLGAVDEGAWIDEVDARFDAAREAAASAETGGVASLFDHVYAERTAALEAQLADLRAFLDAHPGGGGYIEERPKG